MKKITMIVVVSLFVCGNAFAATIIDDVQKRTIINDLATEQEAVQAGKNCIDLLQSECLNGTSRQCVAILPVCSGVFVKCRNSGNATKKWVAEQIRIAMNSTASKADLDALRKEMNRKFRSLQRQIDKLREEIKVERERNDAQDKKLKDQQAQINEHETKLTVLNSEVELHDGRIGDLEEGEKVQNDEIRKMGIYLPHLELGAAFVGAPAILAFGGFVGVQLGVAPWAHVVADLGLAGSLDSELTWFAKGGVLFSATEGLGLGLSAIFVKERFDDEGDVEVGGVADIRYTFRPGIFIAGFIGCTAEGAMVKKSPTVEVREWAPAFQGGVMIGWKSGHRYDVKSSAK
jgi:hypothetical protein